MKKLLLGITIIILIVFGYLYLAVEDDKQWFQDFSRQSKDNQLLVVDFTYFDISPEAYSVKVREDSVFFRQYFSSSEENSIKDSVTYFSILSPELKSQFSSLSKRLKIDGYETTYGREHIDGKSASFVLRSNSTTKKIEVKDSSGPRELVELQDFLKQVKGLLSFTPWPITEKFESNHVIVPPCSRR